MRPKGASVVPVGDAIVRTLPGFRNLLDAATPLRLPGGAFCPISRASHRLPPRGQPSHPRSAFHRSARRSFLQLAPVRARTPNSGHGAAPAARAGDARRLCHQAGRPSSPPASHHRRRTTGDSRDERSPLHTRCSPVQHSTADQTGLYPARPHDLDVRQPHVDWRWATVRRPMPPDAGELPRTTSRHPSIQYAAFDQVTAGPVPPRRQPADIGRGRRYVLGGTHIDDLYRRIGVPYIRVTGFLR